MVFHVSEIFLYCPPLGVSIQNEIKVNNSNTVLSNLNKAQHSLLNIIFPNFGVVLINLRSESVSVNLLVQ